ncbi:MAG: DsbC family protein [Steroidobacteraceae bacterium]
MKHKWLTAAALSIALINATSAADAALEKLKQSLSEKFPALKIQAVNPSILPGLYEVVTADEIIYTDKSGDHVVLGQIMDAHTRDNLTQQRWAELNKIDFQTLPFDKAIKIVKGDGSRRLAVFADPLCPYCKLFEKNLQDVTDITLYLFLYPLESIHPGATEVAQSIWCSADRAAAWEGWMIKQVDPTAETCEGATLLEVTDLGVKLKINSTPTLIFTDGTRQPGALSAEKLEQRLGVAH